MHNSTNLVSVIVPVYNSGASLAACIESILSQSYTNFELILVNDGSTDCSRAVCERYMNDDRVKLFTNTNHGVSYSRNYGLQKASGKYITFVDSDDTVERDMLQKLVDGIDGNDICICGMVKEYLTVNELVKTEEYCCADANVSIQEFLKSIEQYLAKQLVQGPCGKLYTKRIIDDNDVLFPEGMSYGEDTYFVYNYLKAVSNVAVINDCLYHAIVRGKNSLNTMLREDKILIHIQLMDELEKVFECHSMELPTGLYERRIQGAYVTFFDQSSYLGRNQFIEIMKRINSNPTVYSVFDQNCGTIQTRIISVLVKKKLLYMEYVFFRLKRIWHVIKKRN